MSVFKKEKTGSILVHLLSYDITDKQQTRPIINRAFCFKNWILLARMWMKSNPHLSYRSRAPEWERELGWAPHSRWKPATWAPWPLATSASELRSYWDWLSDEVLCFQNWKINWKLYNLIENYKEKRLVFFLMNKLKSHRTEFKNYFTHGKLCHS